MRLCEQKYINNIRNFNAKLFLISVVDWCHVQRPRNQCGDRRRRRESRLFHCSRDHRLTLVNYSQCNGVSRSEIKEQGEDWCIEFTALHLTRSRWGMKSRRWCRRSPWIKFQNRHRSIPGKQQPRYTHFNVWNAQDRFHVTGGHNFSVGKVTL